jgi:hypothetical protein
LHDIIVGAEEVKGGSLVINDAVYILDDTIVVDWNRERGWIRVSMVREPSKE